ncbi:hypothetical protein [Tenacibaculum finnmarkense]|uniref:hypothetical protein n=1 Tax=Tenacibaculum finnmarkense TaxID=2781243 RepID=UPI001E5CDF12|nr:hypothetical protein [Tenacibaculum finnmarkense]MCD8410898.1 hypothetical protein [Tenacibaculum finnmarkense genomovar ulcerans]
MDRIIFHIPNKINKNLASGSQIRPIKMLNAFKKIGYQVDVVMGDVKQRKQQINQIKNNIKQGIKYSFLYSESSTMPTALTESHHLPVAPFLDFNFFKFCKKNEIKIGLFYRDIHWRFEQYKETTSFLKRILAVFFYKFDLCMYKKTIQILYLPTKRMYSFIPFKFNNKIKNLPPAFDFINKTKSVKNNYIYVGGLGTLYDLRLFVKVINSLDNVKFHLCTREKEWDRNKNNYDLVLNNVNIHHLKGDKLQQIYDDSFVAVLFVKPTIYWDFVMAVKTFEYISYSKPIIAVKGTAVGDFIESNNIGWTIPYEETALRDLLLFIENNPLEIQNKVENINNIAKNHTWEARAKQVRSDLTY